MTAPSRPVLARSAGIGFFLLLAAVILFVVCAVIVFTNGSGKDATGLGFIGLACLAAGMIVP